MGGNLKVRMKDLPLDERPREKLITLGPDVLSNAELLAIILRTGSKDGTAIRLAEKVLSSLGGLRGLLDISIEELKLISGIGQVKAVQLMALGELTKRVQSAIHKKQTIESTADIVNVLMPQLRFLTKEVFYVVLLDCRNQIISIQEISKGCLTGTIVHPREVFREAIRRNCSAIILAHNHPSGNPGPSQEDIEITKRLLEGSYILGIHILDHLIIGDGQYISFKEQGII